MKRWTLIVIVLIGVGFGYMSDFVSGKYGESTVPELFKIVESDYSKELYTMGTINYVSEEIADNKKITLTEGNISNLLNLFDKTTATGIKRKDLDALDIRNTYIVDFESKVANSLTLFVGRDENTQNVILEIFATDKKLADRYLVQDEEVFHLIEELIKQAP